MTQRERQILKWIEENPLISQQELADKAGIARSSVAVHISNLMKQGHIAGKGYIVRTAPYVVVVGGVNLDIGGRPHGELVAADSNPGQVRMSLGGVGRNIAHNMALMGLDVRMLTAFGDDMNAQRIAASCGELGIDISQCLTVPGGATSTYLFITDGHGDMALAVSDMEIYEHVTPAFLAGRARLLQNAQLLVVDTNIPAQSIAWLAENIRLPIFADPVSTAKAEKLRPVVEAPHPQAQPAGGGAALRRAHYRRGEPQRRGRRPAGHRPAAGIHQPGGRRGVRRRPQRAGTRALLSRRDGEHHRLRRRGHGRHRLGLSGGHRAGGYRPGRHGRRGHRHGERRDDQPRHERPAAPPEGGLRGGSGDALTFWTAQILGLIGSLLAFTAVQTGSRRKIIGLQLVCCVLWVVQYVLLGAWTGVLINLLGLARGVVCAYNDRPWARSRLWLALFLACYGAAPLLTWDGPYCLLLGAAMMLTTAALWTRNMRLTRLLFLLNSPPVFAYNLIAGSYTGAAIEVAAFCSFALAVWRFDLRRPAAGPSSPA